MPVESTCINCPPGCIIRNAYDHTKSSKHSSFYLYRYSGLFVKSIGFPLVYNRYTNSIIFTDPGTDETKIKRVKEYVPSAILVGGRVAEIYSHLAGDLDGDQRIQELPRSRREEPQ